jgi:hypothetical protein
MLKPEIIVVTDILGAPKGERVEEPNEAQSNLVSGILMTVNLYTPLPDVVVAPSPLIGRN